jgi:hypothetical protein
LSSERPRKSSSCFPDGTEYERTYNGVEIHKPGWRVKIKSPMQISIGVLGIDKGFQNFRYTSRLKNQKRLADVFERGLPI